MKIFGKRKKRKIPENKQKTGKKKRSPEEKKLLKRQKKINRKIKKLRKKMGSTLEWLEIFDVQKYLFVLNNKKKNAYVMGVKLTPHDIFIDDTPTQDRWIDNLRIAMNKMADFTMYFNYVHSPVHVEEYLAGLREASRHEMDPLILDLMNTDVNKMIEFSSIYKELEFFVMVKESSEFKCQEEVKVMMREFDMAGFSPVLLEREDFLNYVEFVFENGTATDLAGVISIFSTEKEAIQNQLEAESYEVSDQQDYMEVDPDAYQPVKNEHLILRSRLAPTCFLESYGWYLLGDHFVSNILVKQLPADYGLGLMLQFVNNNKIKVFMKTEKSNINLSQVMMKDTREKNQELGQTHDPWRNSTLNKDLISNKQYVDQVIQDNDKTLNVTIVFSIYGDDYDEMKHLKEDLIANLRVQGIISTNVFVMQEPLIRFITPLFVDDGELPRVNRDNLGVLLPSRGFVGLYPNVFETLKDGRGLLMGHQYLNGGVIIFDPFFWLHKRQQAIESQRINGNIIVVGKSGTGKSTVMNLIIRSMIKEHTRIVWIDPENQNKGLTMFYQGTYLEWGKPNNMINLFDLKKITTDDDEDDRSLMYDTELAINNVTADLNIVLQYLFPNISEDTLTITGDIVMDAYEKVGIVRDENGRYPSFQGLSYKDMPTFTTFNDCLLERIEKIKTDPSMRIELGLLEDMKIKMKRIMKEWGIYFNGQTRFRQNSGERDIISFGIKELFNKEQTLRNALNYIMFKFSWDLCLDNADESAFILDEAHMLILEGKTAEMVAQFYRRARKYNTVMVAGTQQPGDFADESVITHGKAIFNNAVYKLILHLDKDDCEDVKKLVRLNGNESDLIAGFTTGDALFVCGNRRIPIHVHLTERERYEMRMS